MNLHIKLVILGYFNSHIFVHVHTLPKQYVTLNNYFALAGTYYSYKHYFLPVYEN